MAKECTLNLEPGAQPKPCVLDKGFLDDCAFAHALSLLGKSRNDCEHWKGGQDSSEGKLRAIAEEFLKWSEFAAHKSTCEDQLPVAPPGGRKCTCGVDALRQKAKEVLGTR